MLEKHFGAIDNEALPNAVAANLVSSTRAAAAAQAIDAMQWDVGLTT
jgi:hypothetical protein